MESKKTILALVIVFIFVLLFGLGYLDKGKDTAEASAFEAGGSHPAQRESSLTSSETVYDFGTISMKNGDVTKDFTVTNATDKEVLLKTLVTSCMCTRASIVRADGTSKGPFGMPGMGRVPPANERIAAGDSRIIRVVYDPNAHGPAGVGQIDRFAELEDENGGKLQLEIKALVQP
ncbi:MAG: hypothetical protein UY50_C0011G0020 [Parcubacteria group bacterium GW2011_GWA2_49_9]|nr:MAG: hypothetical protein UY50_C0011G0020 [Parcubacteria group bacterium GW2011_GWA2_49_9]